MVVAAWCTVKQASLREDVCSPNSGFFMISISFSFCVCVRADLLEVGSIAFICERLLSERSHTSAVFFNVDRIPESYVALQK